MNFTKLSFSTDFRAESFFYFFVCIRAGCPWLVADKKWIRRVSFLVGVKLGRSRHDFSERLSVKTFVCGT